MIPVVDLFPLWQQCVLTCMQSCLRVKYRAQQRSAVGRRADLQRLVNASEHASLLTMCVLHANLPAGQVPRLCGGARRPAAAGQQVQGRYARRV